MKNDVGLVKALPFLSSQNCLNFQKTADLLIARPPAPTTTPPTNFQRALNYKTEPLAYRYLDPKWEANTPAKAPKGIARALSNSLVLADPQTPVFAASKGQPVRIRMVHPAGNHEQSITLHGHVWQEEPYTNGSTVIGNNPESQWMGDRDAFGPNNQFDIVLNTAGGDGQVTGDYLLRTFIGTEFTFGMWGILRVGELDQDIVTVTRLETKPPIVVQAVAKTGGGFEWQVNGKLADKVAVEQGDLVQFEIATGLHGLHFASKSAFDNIFQFNTATTQESKFQTGTNCGVQNTAYFTTPQNGGVIAVLQVTQDATLGTHDFECSQHCGNMKGSFQAGLNTPGAQPTLVMTGINTVNPNNGQMASQVTISDSGNPQTASAASVDPLTGMWTFTHKTNLYFPITITSAGGGVRQAPRPINRLLQLGPAPPVSQEVQIQRNSRDRFSPPPEKLLGAKR
ncbi:MAG: hypothetical protein ETSY2_28155 [Candidatus Entotheonella gemina]|uniref:Plastocyanin-like domain-containing protein n=1 Tax=Candidatus Entotheonella gemina TaxID=1429439 RepID=W4M301_9BACT|nr:MAG: hypothetical protein ETSY2_28155 [Candidatus Entotheonella gemina]